VAVPLFHVTGLIAQFLAMAHVGGTTVVMPAFNAAEALRLIDRGAHHAPDRRAHRLRHADAGTGLPGARRTLRVLAYGGAPTPPDTIRALREWLPQARLHNAYGMTETCSPTTILADEDARARASTVGRPIPTADVRTVHHETGAECGADEVGELWVRGPMVIRATGAIPRGRRPRSTAAGSAPATSPASTGTGT
jgi:acyl-CoA synthetase (AMP-forming)/AMP-acid ligase II